MSQLAIQGHPTRGKEVIEILEMLGGNNIDGYLGNDIGFVYIINSDDVIDWNYPSTYDYFTLEEFLEKFPYKIGNKVLARGSAGEITDMKWQGDSFFTTKEKGEVVYTVMLDTEEEITFSVEDLQPHKEQETMEYRLDNSDEDKLATEITCDDFKVVAPDNYLIGKVTKVDGGIIVEYVNKKPQYPKTYKECCDILKSPHKSPCVGYKGDLLESLQKLLVCRDAYWKLNGDWKPDWSDNKTKYIITVAENKIYTDVSYIFNYVLSFPTKEMRDEFCENFKDLIEECKELL